MFSSNLDRMKWSISPLGQALSLTGGVFGLTGGMKDPLGQVPGAEVPANAAEILLRMATILRQIRKEPWTGVMKKIWIA